MPADSGMAFVLVQHLSPDHKSMLSELVGKSTLMDVIEATDGVDLKPDCVFVIPPDATVTICNSQLKIVRPAPPRDRRRPIDTFFESLAEDQGENAICIILSGIRRAGKGTKAALEAVRANAVGRAADYAETIADVRASGATSLAAIAAELNLRGIVTPRGGQWHPSSVSNLIARIDA